MVAARADCRLEIDDLVAYGTCTVVGPAQLRFQLDETLELVRARFGTRVDRDAAARLHELTEGWPLGLQLALSVMASGSDPQAEIAVMRGAGRRAARPVRQPAAGQPGPGRRGVPDAHRDPRPPASRALPRPGAWRRRAASACERLARDTPVFVAGEASEWLRMHALARGELRRRFLQLPADRAGRRCTPALPTGWPRTGLLEAAARHALAAGQREPAYDLAERSLYESLMARGRQGTVLEWLARLPADELDRRPRLLLAAAWSLALSERHEEASRFVAAHPRAARGRRRAALRMRADPERRGGVCRRPRPLRRTARSLGQDPPLRDPLLLQVHANRSAFRALLEGEPALARLRQQQAPRGGAEAGDRLPRRAGANSSSA